MSSTPLSFSIAAMFPGAAPKLAMAEQPCSQTCGTQRGRMRLQQRCW